MKVRCRCQVCGYGDKRAIREDGTVAPCKCGGPMVKQDRWVEKRIAKAKEDLQWYGGVLHTSEHTR